MALGVGRPPLRSALLTRLLRKLELPRGIALYGLCRLLHTAVNAGKSRHLPAHCPRTPATTGAQPAGPLPSQGGGVHPQRTDFSGSAPRGLRCVPTHACPKEVARLQACKPVPTAQAAGKGSDRASLARGPRHLAGRGPGQPCPEAAGHLGEEEAQGLLLGSVGTCSGRGLAPSRLPAKPMLIGRGDCASRAGRAHSLVGHGGQGQVRPLPLHQHSPHLLQLRGGLWLQVGSQGDLVPEA